MVTQYKIVQSAKEPLKNVLWLKDNKLWHYNGGWEPLFKGSAGGGATKLSELKNDVGYITKKDIPTYDLTKYALKTEIPKVPTKISELNNDAGYITAENIPSVELPDNIATTEYVNRAINDAIVLTLNTDV